MAVNLEQENARLRDEVYSSHSEINKLKAENERLRSNYKRVDELLTAAEADAERWRALMALNDDLECMHSLEYWRRKAIDAAKEG